ncbi:MAG: transcriptional activator NhaR [Deltaproteobacteria bacterium]|jgi:LysR family transcriptional activator of nhaA|nr:transcriptional activator NhaR [Deltaproteobacteria bacterium]MBW2533301.1 transcriptional activator NhaR [Deltaproteobacteria bacterium]
MEWLNYHHFLYFWVVAREGGLLPASKVLRLAHPTISGQIKQLEESLGEQLFDRSRRKLELTEMGKVAYRYADEIFRLGQEFLDVVRDRPTGRPLRLVVGVTDVMPKLVVRWLLTPVLDAAEPVQLVCREDRHDRLLADLALHQLDVVLADAPIPPGSNIRAFNHLLGESGVTFFAADELARRYRKGFPTSLDGAPFLLPTEDNSFRRGLEQWFDAKQIRPEAVAEFEDSALLKVFGQDGFGVFGAPTIVADAIGKKYGVRVVGRTDEITERFYAISAERRIKHPAVAAICDSARDRPSTAPAWG